MSYIILSIYTDIGEEAPTLHQVHFQAWWILDWMNSHGACSVLSNGCLKICHLEL
jgi:hypothetical protein